MVMHGVRRHAAPHTETEKRVSRIVAPATAGRNGRKSWPSRMRRRGFTSRFARFAPARPAFIAWPAKAAGAAAMLASIDPAAGASP
jgi:hypothetical protein